MGSSKSERHDDILLSPIELKDLRTKGNKARKSKCRQGLEVMDEKGIWVVKRVLETEEKGQLITSLSKDKRPAEKPETILLGSTMHGIWGCEVQEGLRRLMAK